MPGSATKSVFDDVPPFPGENPASNPRAVMGGNRPPLEDQIPADFRDELLREKPDFLVVLDRYLGGTDPTTGEAVEGAVDRAKAEDDETLASCGKVVKALRAAEQHVGAVHKAVKEPYLQGGRLVDAEKNALVARITNGRAKVERLMNEYAAEQLRKERESAAAAAEERRKLEELARENNLAGALPPPPPPAPKAAPVRSDGVTVSTTIEHVGVVEDYAKAFRKVKDDARVREAIDAAIQRLVKAAKGQIEIPGVRIDEQVKTGSR